MWSGKPLADLRIDSDLSQRELGEKLHISNTSISAYENSTRCPSLELIGKMADAFDVSTDYLLGRTNLRLSPTVLSSEFANGVSYAYVLQTLTILSPKQRAGLLTLLEDMRFRAEVTKHANRNGEDMK